MTFFSKLFGKKKEAISTTVSPEMEKELVPKEIFIEERDPFILEIEDKISPAPEDQPILGKLLSRDYRELGFKDGYHLHDLGRLQMQLDIIASDFRQACDRVMQDLTLAMEVLKPHLTERMESEIPELYLKSKTTMEYYESKKRELQMEKDLAVLGEGYIERSVRYYKAGFIEGYTFYLEDEKMFKPFKLI